VTLIVFNHRSDLRRRRVGLTAHGTATIEQPNMAAIGIVPYFQLAQARAGADHLQRLTLPLHARIVAPRVFLKMKK
jgi:hypothetical protein